MKTSIAAALSLLAVPSLAHAERETSQDARPDPRDRSRDSATVGLGTPLGEIGAEYTVALAQHVELGLGVGYSYPDGPQAALMPRLRTRHGAWTYTLGAGVSGGHYEDVLPPSSEIHATDALWANVEGGVQVSSAGGVFARLFLGVGKVVAHTEVMDVSGEGGELLDTLPYLGLSVGFTP